MSISDGIYNHTDLMLDTKEMLCPMVHSPKSLDLE